MGVSDLSLDETKQYITKEGIWKDIDAYISYMYIYINENEEFETSKKTGSKFDLSTILAVSSDENTVIFS